MITEVIRKSVSVKKNMAWLEQELAYMIKKAMD